MNVTVSDVLGSLFNPTDTVCFRVFDDKKDGIFQGAKLSCECGKYKSIEETLKNHNAMNRGIFFVVNYGGQDDASITRINAQFVEMDNDSFEDQQKKINAFPLPPSMIMKTQKSYHVYWFMDSSAKVERFRTIQTQLVKQFDGDPMCVNESRVAEFISAFQTHLRCTYGVINGSLNNNALRICHRRLKGDVVRYLHNCCVHKKRRQK